jgi:hypothetical protein
MKAKDLVTLWTAPDNSRLMPRQMSIRLPIHVAAKIAALCEMFPRKTKTEIIGDLLATALEDFAEGLSNEPYVEEHQYGAGAHPDESFGDRRRYFELAEKYVKEMEIESGATHSLEVGEGEHSPEIPAESASAPGSQSSEEGGAGAAKSRRARRRFGR